MKAREKESATIRSCVHNRHTMCVQGREGFDLRSKVKRGRQRFEVKHALQTLHKWRKFARAQLNFRVLQQVLEGLADLTRNSMDVESLIVSVQSPTSVVKKHSQFTKRSSTINCRFPSQAACKIANGGPVFCCVTPALRNREMKRDLRFPRKMAPIRVPVPCRKQLLSRILRHLNTATVWLPRVLCLQLFGYVRLVVCLHWEEQVLKFFLETIPRRFNCKISFTLPTMVVLRI